MGIIHRTNGLIRNPGTIAEDFESLSGWTVIGAGASMSLDTTHFRSGVAAIKISSPVGSNAQLQKANTNIDLSAGENIRLSVYVPDITKFSSISIYFGNDPAAFTNFFYWISTTPPAGLMKTGWNELSIAKSKFLVGGGAPNWANSVQIWKIRIDPLAGQSIDITCDSLRIGYTSTPVVLLVFDDGLNNTFSKAYPILAANGQKATAYIVKDWIGNVGFMTAANLRTLHTAGWTIGNHTTSHEDLTILRPMGVAAEIEECRDYLVSLGLTGVNHLAYPWGLVNDAVYQVVKNLVGTARTVRNPCSVQAFIEQFEDMPWFIKSMTVELTAAPSFYQTMIEKTIEECGMLMLLFHAVVDSGGGAYDYLTANLQTLSNYLKVKSDAGLLQVMTIDQYYQCFKDPAPPPPVPVIRRALSRLMPSGSAWGLA